ncbi:hypothetical protein UFOVP75_174 [uncultured Caudovirales phage]|uniref:Uncharacterized protein n=1 Tax=uncultured Caudovirales phage TaxID=2100421 RepID=A0A6J5L2G3_9CAUD|nr:hypothetical protein UFOVP75_174 [uncultured Caudovirales phage]
MNRKEEDVTYLQVEVTRLGSALEKLADNPNDPEALKNATDVLSTAEVYMKAAQAQKDTEAALKRLAETFPQHVLDLLRQAVILYRDPKLDMNWLNAVRKITGQQ